MPPWLDALITSYLPTAAALLGWWKFFLERRDKHRAEAKEAAAESREAASHAELTAVRRRSLAHAPYFAVSDIIFSYALIPTSNPDRMEMIDPGQPDVLSCVHHEVGSDLAAGHIIWLLVENRGSHAEEVALHLDGEPVAMRQAQIEGAAGRFFICYPYCPEKRGAVQTIEVGFLAHDGVRDLHRYQTLHGRRGLRRINPA